MVNPFYFVDRISHIDDRSITGEVTFPRVSPMRERDGRAPGHVAAGALCEALGQLVSWWMLHHNDFAGRPVFLLADSVDIIGAAPVDTPIRLWAEVTRHEPADPATGQGEVVVFSAGASEDGRELIRLREFTMSSIPSSQTEDAERTRARYAQLRSGGEAHSWADQGPFDLRPLVGLTPDSRPGRVMATVEFPARTWFFATHFPLFPCAPIVILLETLRTVTAMGMDPDGARGLDDHLFAESIRGLKIRNFIRPGEAFACRVDTTLSPDGGRVATRALITAADKRIVMTSIDYVCESRRPEARA